MFIFGFLIGSIASIFAVSILKKNAVAKPHSHMPHHAPSSDDIESTHSGSESHIPHKRHIV